jgi:ankyrin repeat protein
MTPLHSAVTNSHSNIVEVLLSNNADVNAVEKVFFFLNELILYAIFSQQFF